MSKKTNSDELKKAKEKAFQEMVERADYRDNAKLLELKRIERQREKQELERQTATTPLYDFKKQLGKLDVSNSNYSKIVHKTKLSLSEMAEEKINLTFKNTQTKEKNGFDLYSKISIKLKQVYTDETELKKLSVWNYGTLTPYDKLKEILKNDFGKGFAGKAKNNYLNVVKLIAKKNFNSDLCKCSHFLIKNRDLLPDFNVR